MSIVNVETEGRDVIANLVEWLRYWRQSKICVQLS